MSLSLTATSKTTATITGTLDGAVDSKPSNPASTPTITVVFVGTSATALTAAATRLCVKFSNPNTIPVYIKNADDVTTSNGFAIMPGMVYEDFETQAAWHGIANATVPIGVMVIA